LYRVDVRLVGPPLRGGHWDHNGADSAYIPYEGHAGVDAVYSFRSGRGAEIERINIPRFDQLKPAERLRQLGQFYRDFSESASALSTEAARENRNRHSTVDTGHEFFSVKVRDTGFRGTKVHLNSGGRSDQWYWAPKGAPCMPLATHPVYKKFSDLWVDQHWLSGNSFNSLLVGANPDTQAVLNSLFSDMRSSQPTLDIGETLVELVKGGPLLLLQQLLTQFDRLIKVWKRPQITTRDFQDLAAESGGAYLYSTFAVAPFVNDVRKVIESLTTIHTLVYGSTKERYRRVHTNPIRTGSGTSSPRYSYAYGKAYAGNTGGSLPYEWTQSADTRLVSRFSGLAKPNARHNGFIEKANALWYNLGMQEPELLWDLTSFSWLLDWWLHLGSSISNAQAFSGRSGASIDYAYATTVIRTLTTQRVNTPSVTLGSGVSYSRPAGLLKNFTEVKYRRQATPFGFGGDLSSLTSGQMSILTALGLAKTR